MSPDMRGVTFGLDASAVQLVGAEGATAEPLPTGPVRLLVETECPAAL